MNVECEDEFENVRFNSPSMERERMSARGGGNGDGGSVGFMGWKRITPKQWALYIGLFIMMVGILMTVTRLGRVHNVNMKMLNAMEQSVQINEDLLEAFSVAMGVMGENGAMTMVNATSNYADALTELEKQKCTRFGPKLEMGSPAQLALIWCPETASAYLELPRTFLKRRVFKLIGQAEAGSRDSPMINEELLDVPITFESNGESGMVDVTVPRFDIRARADSNLDLEQVNAHLSSSRILPLTPLYANLTLRVVKVEEEEEEEDDEEHLFSGENGKDEVRDPDFNNDDDEQRERASAADDYDGSADPVYEVVDILPLNAFLSPALIGVLDDGGSFTNAGSPPFSAGPHITDAFLRGDTVVLKIDLVEIDPNADGGETYRGIWLNMVPLSEEPMTPRVHDRRIGYFSDCFKDVGGKLEYEGGAAEALREQDESICYIKRWRLDPKEEGCTRDCEPRKPIVYHVDSSVPERWRTCIAGGINAWNSAFGAAGWAPGTIRAVLPGSDEWPVDYSPLDARYNSISWDLTDSGYAIGPSESDPRSGELINADIVFDGGWAASLTGHWARLNYWDEEGDTADANDMSTANMNRAKSFKMVEVERLDALAQAGTLFSLGGNAGNITALYDFVCKGLTEISMHEVGHTLGLRHNFRASYAFAFDSRESQLSASVMDYNAYIWRNDTLPIEPFMSRPGEYDVWAIRYGYTIGNDDEIASIAEEEGTGRAFCTDDDLYGFASELDPSCSTRDISSDTELYFKEFAEVLDGLKNDAYSNTYLNLRGNTATVTRNLLYLLGTLRNGVELVAKHIGGAIVEKVYADSRADVLSPIPAAKQRSVADFIASVLASDEKLYLPREHADKLVVSGGLERSWLYGGFLGLDSLPVNVVAQARAGKQRILNTVFTRVRLQRMMHNEWVAEHMQQSTGDNEEADRFTIRNLIDVFHRAIMGEIVNTSVGVPDAVTGDGTSSSTAGCDPDAMLPLSTAETRFTQMLWIKKLIALSGDGFAPPSLLAPHSSGYDSGTAYAHAAIGTLEILRRQIDCLLGTTLTDMDAYARSPDIFDHLVVLRAAIDQGWWRT